MKTTLSKPIGAELVQMMIIQFTLSLEDLLSDTVGLVVVAHIGERTAQIKTWTQG